MRVVLVTPADYFGAMVDILKDKRAEEINIIYLDDGTVSVKALMPWQEVVCDMSDMIKQRSSGYANFNYTVDEYRESNLSKVEIAVNSECCITEFYYFLLCMWNNRCGVYVWWLWLRCCADEVCEALSFIAHKGKAYAQGRRVAEKLKASLNRQQFEIIIQAKVGSKVCRAMRSIQVVWLLLISNIKYPNTYPLSI